MAQAVPQHTLWMLGLKSVCMAGPWLCSIPGVPLPSSPSLLVLLSLAHLQLPRMKFSCLAGPSVPVPEHGRVKRSEASWRGRGQWSKVHPIQLTTPSRSPIPGLARGGTKWAPLKPPGHLPISLAPPPPPEFQVLPEWVAVPSTFPGRLPHAQLRDIEQR